MALCLPVVLAVIRKAGSGKFLAANATKAKGRYKISPSFRITQRYVAVLGFNRHT
ncbi:Uncharacterised protein [Yersinia intermedia]|nr:Uncharacterised protein [Yersinia intermedia]